MKRNSLNLIVAVLLSLPCISIGQCDIEAFSSEMEITCGDCATLSAFGTTNGTVAFEEDFNSGSPSGWQFTQTTTIGNNICGVPSPDGSDFMWMGDASVNPRDMTTVGYDLTLGGTVCFEMRYSVQGDAAPCEGPDEPDEGVFLQYSTDGGATWNTINYWDPNGGNDPALTGWNNYCAALPAGAQTGNTMIRWHQDDVSGAEYDHWGIDNVVITLNDPTSEIVWTHDGFSHGVGSPGGDNPTQVCPLVTTSYTATISNSTGNTCNTSVTITVVDPVIDISAGNDTTICPGACFDLNGVATVIQSPASTPTFDNNEVSVISGTPAIPFFGDGEVNADMNINVTGLNTTSLSNGSITSVCVSGFSITPLFGSISLSNVEINLTCPGGGTIQLVQQGDLSGNNITNMCFEVGAPNVSGGTDPYTGTFAPEDNLSLLNGCDPNGLWVLNIFGVNPDTDVPVGSISGWSISFDDPAIEYPATYTWSPLTDMTAGQTTLSPTVCPTSDITYTITAEDVNACVTETAQVAITIGSCCLIDIAASVTQQTCALNDGEIDLTINGGVGAYTFDWGGGVTSEDLNGLSDGSYTVTITDPGAGCSKDTTIVIDAVTGPTITSATPVDASCGASDGTITVVASGDPTLQYSSDNATSFQASGSLTGLAAGTYDVVVEDGNGCQATQSVTVGNSTGPTITSATPADASCGTSDGTITVVASGDPTLQYSSDNATTFQASGSFTGLAAGTYDVVVEDGNGCQTSQSVTVNGGGGPTIDNVAPTDPSCTNDDGTIVITASGGSGVYTYSIDNGTTSQAGNSFGSLAGGSFDIVVDDGSGCTATSTTSLTAGVSPVIDLVVSGDATCGASDGSLTITASGGSGVITYSIDNGTTFQAGNSFPGLAANTYDVVVEDGLGCQATGTGSVSNLGAPTIDNVTSVDETCLGNDASITITASGGTGALSYSIDNGVTDQATGSFTTLTNGTYNIVVEDGSGCQATSAVTITQGAGPAIDAAAPTHTTCGNTNGELAITASGGTPALTYSIDNGVTFQATGNFTGLADGNFDVVVEDGIGCQAAQTVTINPSTGLTVDTEVHVDPSCGANDGSINLTVSGGSGAYAFTIDNGVSTQATGFFVSLSAGSYTVSVDDGAGCTIDSIVTLNNVAGPSLDNVSITQPTCGFNNGEINITASGGTGALTYSIDNGTTVQATGTFTGLNSGTYDIVVSDGTCPVTQTVVLNPSAALVATVIVEDLNCFEDLSGEITIDVPVGPVYSFDIGGPVQVSNVFSGLSAGFYDVTVTDPDGCVYTELGVEITEPNVLELDISVNQPTCFQSCDGIALADIDGGTTVSFPTFNWSDFAAGSSSGQASNLCAGNYSVSILDDNGCTASASYEIIDPIEMAIQNVVTTDEICFGDCQGSIDISSTNAVDYSIDNGATYQSVGLFENLCPGIYNIVVQDATGCQAIDQTEVISPNQVVADFDATPQPTTIFNPEVTMEGNSDFAQVYEWFIDGVSVGNNTDLVYIFPDDSANTYEVCLIASNLSGCSDEICKTIEIGPEQTIFVPNAFTPNSDGKNDTFGVAGIGLYDYELLIFNRWGQLIWKSNDLDKAWDGLTNNIGLDSKAQDGVYVWKLNYKDNNNKAKTLTGHVTLIR